MQTNSLHHNYSSFIWPFKSEKCEKREKIQEIEYHENGKRFLDEVKNIFHNS